MGKNIDINGINNGTKPNDAISLNEKGKIVTFNNKGEHMFFYRVLAKLDDIDSKIGLLISFYEIPRNASSNTPMPKLERVLYLLDNNVPTKISA